MEYIESGKTEDCDAEHNETGKHHDIGIADIDPEPETVTVRRYVVDRIDRYIRPQPVMLPVCKGQYKSDSRYYRQQNNQAGFKRFVLLAVVNGKKKVKQGGADGAQIGYL